MMAHQEEEVGVVLRSPYAVRPIRRIKFPPPSNINVNMMPYVIGNHSTIPEYLHGYKEIISACEHHSRADSYGISHDYGIGYITIHESFVEAGKTQRRPGIHTDGSTVEDVTEGGQFTRYNGWGGFCGIYLASNLNDSCAVWKCVVTRTGPHGDCEHLRDDISKFHCLKLMANILWGISDNTPHEALPMTASAHRQFFRLVLGPVSAWFAAHSTPNPLGILPHKDCRIVTTNKFELWTPSGHQRFPLPRRLCIAALMLGMQRLQDEHRVADVDPAAFEEVVRFFRFGD